MLYLTKLTSIIKIMLQAIVGLFAGVAYGILWLIAICICVPLLLLLFIPFLIFIIATSILLGKGLDQIDEDA